MALKANILKASLTISNMDIHYYDTLNLTLAQHPSETNERLMIRLLAFSLLASNVEEPLSFTKGLSSDEEPELWRKSLNGTIELWVELGLPSEERLRKACSRSEKVVLYIYGTNHSVDPWWNKIKASLLRFKHLHIIRIPHESSKALETLISTSMTLQCMVEDKAISIASDQTHITIVPQPLNE